MPGRPETSEPVVRRVDDAEPIVWNDHRGDLCFRTLLDATATPTGALSAGIVEMGEGGWMGLHRHPPPETYYFLAGRGRVRIGELVHDVEGGWSVFVPGGRAHAVRNASAEPLRFLFTFATDSVEDVEYEWL